jgi:succinate-semialdehyde dehydrogenase/glutarate-semialdehyde dehydrogenase
VSPLPQATTAPTDKLVDRIVEQPSGVRIDGAVRGDGLTRRPVVNPADGRPFADVCWGGRAEAVDAADTAARAQPGWAGTPAAVRAEALRAVAAALDSAAKGTLPALITRETGKRIAEARAELGLSAVYFRTFADLAQAQQEPTFEKVEGLRHVVSARPVGVVAVLTPWNFPVSIPARKVAAALAAGCAVVFKPSELAPLSSMVLAALLDEHLPAGVVNTVLGTPQAVVESWTAHPAVQAVSFTGSTRVGRIVATSVAPRFLRTVLELGGCAPFVVLPDADPQSAAETLMVAKYRNNGQSCIAANQVFVAAEVAEAFTDAFTAATRELSVGDPLDDTVGLGPMAPSGDPARLRELVAEAVAAGARRVSETHVLPDEGHYVEPTVLVDVPADARVFREEIFGPIAALRTFTDLDEAIGLHHATGYGLAGYVCGTDPERSRAVAARLNAGVIGINTGTPNYPGAPFGGLGLSGLGYEGGPQGLDAFRTFHTTAVRGG